VRDRLHSFVEMAYGIFARRNKPQEKFAIIKVKEPQYTIIISMILSTAPAGMF
jgi:hypothetical protein